jgi:peptidylprolyl isomerase/peptidyl-prolyl cis-trans isomerase B (cyclophilin B)
MHHFRGALAAARTGDDMNPEKASSGSQFYIVTGTAHGTVKLKEALKERALMSFMTDEDNLSYRLRAESYQNRNDMAAMNVLLKEIDAEIKPITDSLYNSLSPRARQLYATWGGFPKLDKEYTVFGSLISGFEVLDAIQKVQTASEDRPVKDVMIIRARVIKE